MRRGWELAFLALGSLRRTPLRVSLTSFGVAIASGALVSMVGFALGVQEKAEEPFQKMELLNRIDVSTSGPAAAKAAHEKSDTSSVSQDLPRFLDEDAVQEIAALPGVLLAYPELRLEPIEIARGQTSRKTSACGLPSSASRLGFVRDALTAGRFLQNDSGNEVILGSQLARQLGFATSEEALGQNLQVMIKGLAPHGSANFHFEQRRLEVVVAGVWDPPGGRQGFSSDAFVLPLEVMKTLPGVQTESALERLWHGGADPVPGYRRIVVRVERPSDLFTVEQRIRQLGFHTYALLGQRKEMRTAFFLLDIVLGAVGTVALVVAGLGIINTLLMAVLERKREIGIYKALGASDGDVRLLFLAEAGLVGLLGGVGGLVLGRVVSWLIEVVVNAIARNQGIDQPVLAFAFPFYLLAGAVLFALAISLVSGVYPAVRAARVDPIRALRSE